jgi:hypothetical protein
MQQQVVRKLATDRIAAGKWGEQPNPHAKETSYLVRVAEGVLIGVAVTFLSAWVCSTFGVKREDKTKKLNGKKRV